MCETSRVVTPNDSLKEADGRDFGGDKNIFGTSGVATDYFPVPSYRTGQREAIEQVEDAFKQGYQYVILEAPVGSGKSLIGASLAYQSNDAHILTVQKLLQDQYQNEFFDMFVMKGRSAYGCKLELGSSCAKGPCKRRKLTDVERKTHMCPYTVARKTADISPVTVHNFDSFYYQNLGRPYVGRALLVVDECHNIEGKFLEFMSFTISNYRRLDLVVPEYDTVAEYDLYLRTELDAVRARCDALEKLKDVAGISVSEVKELDDLIRLRSKLNKYVKGRELNTGSEYVFDYVNHKTHQSVTFRPVGVGNFVRETLFPYGDRVLMMSGTILDKGIFCRAIGLNPDDVAYVSMQNTFPAKNRPIIKHYAGKMSYKFIDDTLPIAIGIFEDILMKFPTAKGIVQTHSEKIADYIRSHMTEPRLTFNKDYDTPQEMLKVHRDKPGSFIIASGLREGLDLKGKLSQVQVFFKVPYPSLGDKRVKRKMEIDDDWYTYTTTLMFIQALGRSVRSDTDKAVTYILDSGFGYFYHKAKKFIPGYIKEAIRDVGK